MKDFSELSLAFIGAGNMAEALVKGLLAGRLCAPGRITVTDPRAERRAHFTSSYGVAALADNAEAAQRADVVVFAVKPQQMAEVLAELRPSAGPAVLWISIAAGVRTATLEAALDGARVVRAMPNTPALVGAGVTAVCGGARASAADVELATTLLGSVGSVVPVREADMDAVTAVSGSGPAYVFYLMEAMLAAAERAGLAADVARTLVLGTVSGAARLAVESGHTPAELRERVTSKGGTTFAALEVLRGRGVAEAVEEAIAAARARSQELSRG